MKTRAPNLDPEGASRRVPTQERSRKRVERIIEAASHVFAADGFEAATMESIAARAETSIGSIYQFFPNKLALFNALARHYHGKLRAFFDLLLSGPLLEQPWGDILDAGIDAFALFHEHEPGFRAVWVGLQVTPEVIEEGEAINRDFAKRIEVVLTAKLPGLPAKLRPVVATMMVEILTAMLIVSARRPAEAKALMNETKALLRRYLAPYEGEAPDAEEKAAAEPDMRKRSERRRPAVRSTR
jgi:AcrR family transcriptional regulator